MWIETRWAWRTIVLAVLMTALAACGGSGGDDDEEEDEDVVEDEDATGLWIGNVTRASGQRPFAVIASPTGEFVGVIIAPTQDGSGRLMVGNGDVTQNSLNATGTLFAPPGGTLPNGQTTGALSIAAARVTERVSITGNYAAAGETASFVLNYDALKTARGAALATIAGTYVLSPPPTGNAENMTLTITSTGVATFATSSGCNGTGNFSVPDAGVNIYAWTLTVSSCPAFAAFTGHGLATLDDNPGAGTNNLIRMFGASNARDLAFGFVGAK